MAISFETRFLLPLTEINIYTNMSDATDSPKERFAPKQAVALDPPKDDIIDREHLAKCDGMDPTQTWPTVYIATDVADRHTTRTPYLGSYKGDYY